MERLRAVPVLVIVAATAFPAAAALATGAVGAPPVGLHGIGPLQLGMTRTAAVSTGWLAGRGKGCPLGGTPPVTYRVRGPKAPRGVRGVVEFERGRLTQLSFTGGVRTTLGVTVGRTTPARMVERYQRAGYQASLRYVGTFQGTFVTVERGGKQVLGGFAQGGRITTLGVPGVPVCE